MKIVVREVNYDTRMGHSKQRLFKRVERINRKLENLEGQKRRKVAVNLILTSISGGQMS